MSKFKDALERLTKSASHSKGRNVKEICEDYEILKEVVGKEEPAKPIWVQFAFGDSMLSCPTCRESLRLTFSNRLYPRCTECGQVIDRRGYE